MNGDVKIFTEKSIQYNLYLARRSSHTHICPNFYLYPGIADMVSITPSQMLYEYEIKISKSDYRHDFKSKANKHHYFSTGAMREWTPNLFYFVVPNELISLDECPKYAGLIYMIDDNAWYGDGIRVMKQKIIKRAPKLHKTQVTHNIKNRINTSLMYRTWSYLEKYVNARPAQQYS